MYFVLYVDRCIIGGDEDDSGDRIFEDSSVGGNIGDDDDCSDDDGVDGLETDVSNCAVGNSNGDVDSDDGDENSPDLGVVEAKGDLE